MTQAPATPELVERLKAAAIDGWSYDVRLLEPEIAAAVAAAHYADALEAQQARIAELEEENRGLIALEPWWSEQAVREIKLHEESRALADRYEKALRAQDDAERRDEQHQELIAQSVGEGWDEVTGGSHLEADWKHVSAAYAEARELRVQALSSQGRHEGGEG